MAEKLISVDVAYATPEKQLVVPVTLPSGSSIYEAVVRSGIVGKFPDLNIETAAMGVFGKAERNPKERVLLDGERVEIYRPLIADPKEVRKKRAAAKAEGSASDETAAG